MKNSEKTHLPLKGLGSNKKKWNSMPLSGKQWERGQGFKYNGGGGNKCQKEKGGWVSWFVLVIWGVGGCFGLGFGQVIKCCGGKKTWGRKGNQAQVWVKGVVREEEKLVNIQKKEGDQKEKNVKTGQNKRSNGKKSAREGNRVKLDPPPDL